MDWKKKIRLKIATWLRQHAKGIDLAQDLAALWLTVSGGDTETLSDSLNNWQHTVTTGIGLKLSDSNAANWTDQFSYTGPRVTQIAAESSVQPADATIRATQVDVEASVQPTDAFIRITQVVIESSVPPFYFTDLLNNWADSIRIGIGLKITDSQTLQDQVITTIPTIGVTASDTMTLQDTVLISIGLVITESINLADSVIVQSAQINQLNLVLTDSLNNWLDEIPFATLGTGPRVTQAVVEASVDPTGSATVRVTQIPVEASVEPDDAFIRVTQIPVEASVLPDEALIRVTQVVIETSIPFSTSRQPRITIMSGSLDTGGEGGSGGGGGGGGTEDILDWCLMSYPERLSFHLKGNAESKYFWKDADGMKFWWIKGPTMNPWDIRLYDSSYLYWWITENGDQDAFTTDTAYKRYETTHGYPTPQGVPLAPRFFTLPATNQTISTITTLAPNPVQRTLDCGADSQTTIQIGDISGVLTGPTVINWGGSIGTQSTLIINYYYSGSSGVYQNRERYFLVKNIGQVQWDHATLHSGVYTVVQTSTFINLLAGGPTSPNFPCYTQSWWLGGVPGSGGNIP